MLLESVKKKKQKPIHIVIGAYNLFSRLSKKNKSHISFLPADGSNAGDFHDSKVFNIAFNCSLFANRTKFYVTTKDISRLCTENLHVLCLFQYDVK